MWYIIYTVTGREHKCLEQLQHYVDEADYSEIFIPHYIVKKHFKGEWHDIRKILFPGYLFVDTDNIEPIVEGLRRVTQYTRVLKNGESIAPVTEEEQKFLSDMMDAGHTVRYSEGFLIGERVCITEGPLQNYQGCIRTVDRHRRTARLEIPVFGGMTPVEVGFGAIKKVTEEEFLQIKEKHIQEKHIKERHLHSSVPDEWIEVVQGTFRGMTGRLLRKDCEKDEWTVGLELFGVETRVVFHKAEIRPLTVENAD